MPEITTRVLGQEDVCKIIESISKNKDLIGQERIQLVADFLFELGVKESE